MLDGAKHWPVDSDAWKLLQSFNATPFELFTLDEDRGETTYRMTVFPEIGDTLLDEFQALERYVKGKEENL